MTVSAPGAHTLEYRGTNAAGTTPILTRSFTIGSVTDTPGTVGGSVGATLSLTLGAPATFGAFTPGVAKDYTAATSATVTGTAGDAALSASDPVTITFKQHIDAGDVLRTGTYSRTLTFTLSTTTP